MGIKEIFRKEEKYLASPKELPDLASEQLNDESQFIQNSEILEPESIREPVPPKPSPEEVLASPEKNQNISVQQQTSSQGIQQVPQQAVQQPVNYVPQQAYPYPMMQHPGMMPFYNYPINPHFYNQQMNNFAHKQDSFHNFHSMMSKTDFDIGVSERGPLRRLLAELDKLETRWHSLSNQKNSLEKELKYLESDIEHKMKMLRTHLAIANESNIVKTGDEFHLCDGQVLYSRADLEAAASSMSKQVFDHHVGPGWNDFEAWVSNCLHDYSLAKRLKNISSVLELQSALKKY